MATVLGVPASGASEASATGVARRRPPGPNVVLILTDDQRWDTLRYMPAVQRLLVARGITFTNAFTTTPVCQPSRASLLTGRYAHGTGLPGNVPPLGDAQRFVGPDASTVATWLQRAGYRTGMFGKYLNQYAAQCPPRTGACYRPPGWDEWHVFLQQAHYDYKLVENGSISSYGFAEQDYSTDVLAAKAVEFVRGARGQPFLLVVALHAPHSEGFLPPVPAPRHIGSFADLSPFRPPSWDEDDVSDKPAWVRRLPRAGDPVGSGVFVMPSGMFSDAMRRGQLESLLAVDEAVERVMAAVDASGQAHDTVVILTSDNGLCWNEHRWNSKACPYDECLRVPMVIRFPALAGGGREEARMALNIDLAPTIATLAGVPVPPNVDGRSLVPLLRGEAGPWRRAFLFEHFAGTQEDPPSFTGVRTRRWKLVQYADPSENELLDLRADPHELQSARPGKDRISRRMGRYLRRLRGPPVD